MKYKKTTFSIVIQSHFYPIIFVRIRLVIGIWILGIRDLEFGIRSKVVEWLIVCGTIVKLLSNKN